MVAYYKADITIILSLNLVQLWNSSNIPQQHHWSTQSHFRNTELYKWSLQSQSR